MNELIQRTSNLVIDDSPLQLPKKLAKCIGVNEAIFVQQLHFWLTNKKMGREFNGRKWIHNSLQEWIEDNFIFWSRNQLIFIIKKLVKEGIVIKWCDSNKQTNIKTMWYTINYNLINEIASKDEPVERIANSKRTKTKNLTGWQTKVTKLPHYPKDEFCDFGSENFVTNSKNTRTKNTEEINTEVAQLSQIDTQGETMDNQDEMDKLAETMDRLDPLMKQFNTIGKQIKQSTIPSSNWMAKWKRLIELQPVLFSLSGLDLKATLSWQENIQLDDVWTKEDKEILICFIKSMENDAKKDYLRRMLTDTQWQAFEQWINGREYEVINAIPTYPGAKDVQIAIIADGMFYLRFGGDEVKVSKHPSIHREEAVTTTNSQGDYLPATPEQLAQVNAGKGEGYIANIPSMFGQVKLTKVGKCSQADCPAPKGLCLEHLINEHQKCGYWQEAEKDALIARLLRENVELKQGKASHKEQDGQLSGELEKGSNEAKVLTRQELRDLEDTIYPRVREMNKAQDKPTDAISKLSVANMPVILDSTMPRDRVHMVANTNGAKGTAFVNGQWVEISLTPEQVNELTKPQMMSISFAVDTPQLPLGFATPPLKSPAMVDSVSKGTKRTTGQNKPKLSDDKTVRELHEGAMELAHKAIAVQAGFVKAESFHDQAMVIADDAFLAQKQQKDIALAKELFSKATVLETKAASQLPAVAESEPSRSILYRSAASLAYNAEEYKTAEKLVNEGLRGYPSPKIKDELLSLRSDIKKALASLKPPKVNLAQDFLKRWCEEVLCYGKRDEATGVYEKATYAISWAMEMKGVKTLLANGRTFDENYADMKAHYRYLKQQAYWQDKHISIQAVTKDLNAWIQRGRPAEQPKPQWQVDKAQKAQLQDKSKALWDELVAFTGGIDSSGTKRPLRYGRDRGKVAKSLMSKGLLAVVEKMSSSGMYSAIVDMTETDMKFAFLNAVKKVVKE